MTTLVTDRESLRRARASMPGRVATVMTMGALHAGHRALVRAAGRRADTVIVTVFVNPLQFGAGEDLDRYPRTLDADLVVAGEEGADVVFAPDVDQMYPRGVPAVRVSAGVLGEQLEGASRPGHFDGVLTVVGKLLHLTRPDVAVFGAKDAQQLALIRRMVTDLDLDVDIAAEPTVREPDGLALSSRNRYLSPDERVAAAALPRALCAGAAAGEAGLDDVLRAAAAVLDTSPRIAVDYLALVDDDTWHPAGPETTRGRLLVAARIGTTRLIDNVPVHLGTR